MHIVWKTLQISTNKISIYLKITLYTFVGVFFHYYFIFLFVCGFYVVVFLCVFFVYMCVWIFFFFFW